MDGIKWVDTDIATLRAHIKEQQNYPKFLIYEIVYDLKALKYNVIGLLKCIRRRKLHG